MPNDFPWYREPSFRYLIALTFVLYFLRATLLPVFGEEPRRAVVAREMLASGDWIVPRLQGLPQLSRPPLQNWMIAAMSSLTGSVDAWAIRLPSLLATLATVVLIYGYSSRRAGPAVAALSATAYLTMFEVLQYGRLGETEAVFTAFVAGSLLLWHEGDREHWNRWLLWPACYLLVAGGMLTKGFQAPLYFTGTVGIYLVSLGRWKELFSLPHLLGVGLFLACFGGWQWAFLARMGFQESWQIHWLNISYRFTDKTNQPFLLHFLQFPFEVWAVMLPGSLLLLPALSADVRARLRPHGDTIRFLAIGIVWAFVFVWIPPGSRARYFLPLMPLCAVLMGLVGDAWLSLPRQNWSTAFRRRCVIGAGIFLAAIYVGPVLSVQARMCEDIAGQVRELKSRLPEGVPLVSFNQLHHSFLYYFETPVRYQPRPESRDELSDDLVYFAYHTHDVDPPPFPFDWEPVDVIGCDRYRRKTVKAKVHIGKRIEPPQDVAEASDMRGGL